MMHSIKKQGELTGSNHMDLNLFASSLNWRLCAYLMTSTADLKTTLKTLLDIHSCLEGWNLIQKSVVLSYLKLIQLHHILRCSCLGNTKDMNALL